LNKVLKDKAFKEVYGELMDEKLKTPPKGFDKEFEYIDLLKYKHYAVRHDVDNAFWFSADVVEQSLEKFRPLYQLNSVINRYIS